MGSRYNFQSSLGNSGNSYGKQDFRDAGAKLQPVNWGGVEATAIQKSFYQEHPKVTRRSQAEVQKWLRENEVTLQGGRIPRPIFFFDEINFADPIVKHLYMNYPKPTTIQSISWPVALSGQDMISIARTGSGKTLGFILPGIMHTLKQIPRQTGEGPSMLVLLPTRELAQQVENVAREYCKLMNLSVACVFGGAGRREQITAFQRGVDVCIATPGRLLDFISQFMANLQRCSFLVLDEADRMLDMGFEPQIRRIVSQTRPDRQTLMFSATWPNEVRSLAMAFQTNPVFLNVGSMELSANHNIEQHVEVINEDMKPARLIQLLSFISQWPNCKTMIFVETKRKADMLNRNMLQKGWPTLCIHGDKSQQERDRVMNEFRSARSPILLATDVVSRGLDITDIRFVINYDYPKNSEDYVHRIGRTARQDNTGTSFTFFTTKDAHKAKDLIEVLKEANQEIPEQLMLFVNGDCASSCGSFLPRLNFENSHGRRELERDYSADSRYVSGKRTK